MDLSTLVDGFSAADCFEAMFGFAPGAASTPWPCESACAAPQPDVWPVKKLNHTAMSHLTEKPVELAARAMHFCDTPVALDVGCNETPSYVSGQTMLE